MPVTHIIASEVGDAYDQGMDLVTQKGVITETRNGLAYRVPGIVITEYTNPCNRVLISPSRDCNPFFHLMEALWMLSGRNDVAWINEFNSAFSLYSDDGETFHGAYGHRWRAWFGYDQLGAIISKLRAEGSTRRAVLGIWDPRADLNYEGKDAPCNDTVKFEIVDGRLNMQVFNRSNDMIWGAYGSNVVHFSILMEYVAAKVRVPMGSYYQISCDYHAYKEVFDAKFAGWKNETREASYNVLLALRGQHIEAPRLVAHPDSFDDQLELFMRDKERGSSKLFQQYSSFFQLASMVRKTWRTWKQGGLGRRHAYTSLAHWHGNAPTKIDWAVACLEWMERRLQPKTEGENQ